VSPYPNWLRQVRRGVWWPFLGVKLATNFANALIILYNGKRFSKTYVTPISKGTHKLQIVQRHAFNIKFPIFTNFHCQSLVTISNVLSPIEKPLKNLLALATSVNMMQKSFQHAHPH